MTVADPVGQPPAVVRLRWNRPALDDPANGRLRRVGVNDAPTDKFCSPPSLPFDQRRRYVGSQSLSAYKLFPPTTLISMGFFKAARSSGTRISKSPPPFAEMRARLLAESPDGGAEAHAI